MVFHLFRITKKEISMKKLLILSFSFILGTTALYVACVSGKKERHNFPTIDSFSQVQDLFNTMGPNCFVFFDVNETLLTAHDYMPRHFMPPLHFSLLAALKHPSLIYKSGYAKRLFSIMLKSASRFVIEPAIIPMIEQLKKQGVKVLVVSNMTTGPVGLIKNMSEWNSEILKNGGILLSNDYTNTVFKKLKARKGNHPELYEGTLCCNNHSKGTVIGEFLDHFKLKPDTIMILDDTASNLESVQKECIKRNITSHCYLYTGAARLKQSSWSIRRAFVQLNHLMLSETWIPDNEADLVVQ